MPSEQIPSPEKRQKNREDVLHEATEARARLKAESSEDTINELMETKSMNFAKRWERLDSFLLASNPSITVALEEFNKKHECSIRCAGLRNNYKKGSAGENLPHENGPTECVFINTFENKNVLPIRIGILYDALVQVKDPVKLFAIFEEEFSKQKNDESITERGNTPLGEQIELWNKPDSFDLPKGKTDVLGTLLEKDANPAFDQLAEEVFKKRFEARVEKSVLTESSDDFLHNVEKSLQRAIDDKKDAFVFYYFTHGKEHGSILSALGDNPDGETDGVQLAMAIAKDHGGKPLCSQIDITIIAESCYSKKQLEDMIFALKRQKVPVKNLRIIATSSETPTAWLTQRPSLANNRFDVNTQALGSDGFKIHPEKVPPMSYYLSYYFQMIDHLESQGKTMTEGAGTFGHAIRFADRMARDDSYVHRIDMDLREQDLQYFHYSTEENKEEFLSDIEKPNRRIVG